MFHVNPAQERRVIRPDRFRLDPRHPLYQGLVVACLGNSLFAGREQDFSAWQWEGRTNQMSDPASARVFLPSLGRIGYRYSCVTNQSIRFGWEPASKLQWDTTLAVWYTGTNPYIVMIGTHLTYQYGVLLYVGPDRQRINFLVEDLYRGAYQVDAYAPGVLTNFHHFVGSRSGTEIKIFLDGRFVTSGSASSYHAPPGAPFYVGGNPVNPSPLGILADGMAWERALTGPEIQILANRHDPMLGGFIVPARRTYFPAAAGPSFKAAWAANLNTYIGIGL